jgi:hypothetical protein
LQSGRRDTASRAARTEAARRLDEAHKLFDEVEHMLADMRRELLGGSGRRR